MCAIGICTKWVHPKIVNTLVPQQAVLSHFLSSKAGAAHRIQKGIKGLEENGLPPAQRERERDPVESRCGVTFHSRILAPRPTHRQKKKYSQSDACDLSCVLRPIHYGSRRDPRCLPIRSSVVRGTP